MSSHSKNQRSWRIDRPGDGGLIIERRFASAGGGEEGCEITSRKTPIARMTYQRFFRRYLRLAGMTGTAREVRSEFPSVYRLVVDRIPPNAPSRKTALPTQICSTRDDKWRAIAARAAECHAQGRPILIGTRSVLASRTMSRWLTAAGLPHAVLNAERSESEAAINGRGRGHGPDHRGTNMAGRGVDIAVDPEALRTAATPDGAAAVIQRPLDDVHGDAEPFHTACRVRRGEPLRDTSEP